MGKANGQKATLTYDSNEIGVTNFKWDESYNEIDTTDTKTPNGESEYIGGKNSRGFSFDLFKDVTVADLALNSAKTLEIEIVDEAGNDATYTGSGILLTKSGDLAIDGAVKVSYSGRFNGTLAEVNTAV